MYRAIHCNRLNNTVYVFDDEKGVLRFPLSRFRYAYRKKVGGSYKSIFGDELEKITVYDDNNPTLFESDLNVDMKVLLDLYPNNEEVSTGHRIVIYDIETSSEGGFPDIDTANKPITAIALYDYTTDKYYSLILDPESKVQDTINGNEILKSYRSEESLLVSFLNLWEELAPTIISGWNSNRFDDPYIYNRIRHVLGKTAVYRLSPVRIVYQNKFNKKMTIAGINLLDYHRLYEKFIGVMKSSYSLANVAKDEELKHQKLTYRGNLDNLYKNDIKRFIEYNLVDVKIIKELDAKHDFINLAIAICHKGRVPYEWFFMSSRFIDGSIVDYIHSMGLIAPNKPPGGREAYNEMEMEGEDGFVGAYVKIPVPNIYSWVASADITSLYPSLIMSLNISPEKKVGKILEWNYDKFSRGEMLNIHIGNSVYGIDDFKKMISNNSFSISSNGVVYDLKTMGVIPIILDKWFEERISYRKLAKEYNVSGNKEKEIFYNRRQLRQKIFMNSIYGNLGLPLFRFYDKDNAEAVTISGQYIIKGAEKIVNDYFNTKFKEHRREDLVCDNVIAIDTDSNYFSFENLMMLDNVQEDEKISYIVKSVTEITNKINRLYDYMLPLVFNVPVERNRIKIIPDVIAKRAIWTGRKRYAMLKVFDCEKMKIVKDKYGNLGELKVVGIDVVRSSFPNAFRKIVGEILEGLLREKDQIVLDEKIMVFEEGIELLSPLALSKGSSIKFISGNRETNYDPKHRSMFGIIKGAPITAKAGNNHNDLLKLWKLDKQYPLIKSGEKCKWIYLKPNSYFISEIAFRGDDTDSDELLKFIDQYGDKQKMFARELKPKLKIIYDAAHLHLPNRGSQLAEQTFDFSEEF